MACMHACVLIAHAWVLAGKPIVEALNSVAGLHLAAGQQLRCLTMG